MLNETLQTGDCNIFVESGSCGSCQSVMTYVARVLSVENDLLMTEMDIMKRSIGKAFSCFWKINVPIKRSRH